MPRLVTGFVLPLLIKIFGGLLAGALGITALSQPNVQAVVAAAKASTGVVLVKRPEGVSSGTAFVAAENLAVTTADIVAGATGIAVKFPGSAWVESKVIETDSRNDLAVLTVPDVAIHPLPFGDTTKVHRGEKVIVVSFPNIRTVGSEPAVVTDGTVSAIREGLVLFSTTKSLGSSGGPVLNLRGEVIGVVLGQAKGEGAGVIGATATSAAKQLLSAAASNPSVTAAAPPAPSPSAQPTPTPPSPPAAAPQPEPTPPPPPPAASPQPAPTPPSPPAAPAQPTPTPPSPPAAPPQPAPTPPPPPAAPPQPAPTPPPAAPPKPTPAPTPPAPPAAPSKPAPAPTPQPPSRAAVGERFLVLPGLSIGPVRIGMEIKEVASALGPSKSSSAPLTDGSTVYRWFAPPKNDGIGVRVSKSGFVTRAWALNDTRFGTQDGLHVGSSEADVRAALGVPSNVSTNAQSKTKILTYERIGMWFSIQEDERYAFYNSVFEIGIIPRKQ